MVGTQKKKLNRRGLYLFLFSIPFIIYIIMFCYVPLIGWGFAFVNYRPGLRFSNLKFEGLKYFKLIFRFWSDSRNALINTLALSFLSFLMAPLPVIFAIALNEVRSRRTQRFIQTATTFPNFVSWIIVYSISFSVFSWNGLLNQILMGIGLIEEPTQILANARYAWIFQTVLSQWKNLGWNSIVYLAAIAAIDAELYDSAAVDGANRFQAIRYITIPGVLPTFVVLFVLSIGNILNVGFDQYFVFSNPTVAHRLEVIDLYTYRLGIGSQDYSFATAVGILKSVVSLVAISIANYFVKRVRGTSVI